MLFNGHWKLVDYGSCVRAGTETVPAFTPRYCAPEVARAVLVGSRSTSQAGAGGTLSIPRNGLQRSRSCSIDGHIPGGNPRATPDAGYRRALLGDQARVGTGRVGKRPPQPRMCHERRRARGTSGSVADFPTQEPRLRSRSASNGSAGSTGRRTPPVGPSAPSPPMSPQLGWFGLSPSMSARPHVDVKTVSVVHSPPTSPPLTLVPPRGLATPYVQCGRVWCSHSGDML